jgi:hypothetical protein
MASLEESAAWVTQQAITVDLVCPSAVCTSEYPANRLAHPELECAMQQLSLYLPSEVVEYDVYICYHYVALIVLSLNKEHNAKLEARTSRFSVQLRTQHALLLQKIIFACFVMQGLHDGASLIGPRRISHVILSQATDSMWCMLSFGVWRPVDGCTRVHMCLGRPHWITFKGWSANWRIFSIDSKSRLQNITNFETHLLLVLFYWSFWGILKLVLCILLRVLGQVQGFCLTQHWFEYFI